MVARHMLAGALIFGIIQALPAIAAPLDTAHAVDAIFSSYGPAGPGCAVGVEQEGKVLYAKGYGLADIDAGRALTPQSSVYMASVSKQVAAMAALLLVDDGRLHLNDSVRKLIPELPAYAEGVTVAQLLNHTSGIRDYFTLGTLNGFGRNHVYTEGGVIDLLRQQQALNFTPGSEFLYSNSGYVLIAMIVQRVSGQRLDDFARARIFVPLGMNASRFQHNHTVEIPDRANGYQSSGDNLDVANSYLDVTGDGGLYSSVDDMLRWLGNLDRPIVGAHALAKMRASARLNNGAPSGYGMGLETSMVRGLELVRHGGSLAGYRTADWWFPGLKLGVVILCNRADARTDDLAGHVASVFLPMSAPSPAEPATPLAAEGSTLYAGLYRDSSGGYLEFGVRDGELFALSPERPMRPTARGQFRFESDLDGPVFVFGADYGLDIVRAGQPTRHLQKIEREELDADAAPAYEGDFASLEAMMPIRLVRRGDGLAYAIGDGAKSLLVATGRDRFWDDTTGYEFVFRRNAAGKVAGFTLNARRARGIVFSRTARQ